VAEETEEVMTMPVKREPIADQVQPVTPSVMAWLKSRGISQNTAMAFQIKSTTRAGKECAAIPYLHGGKIVNWKYRNLTDKAWSASKGGWLCAFNFDMLEPGGVLVITEGEMDAIAVYESGCKNVTSCPNGAPALGAKAGAKIDFLKDAPMAALLESTQAIVLAMDNDEPGIAFREEVAAHIGHEKCRIVSWPDGCKDANDVLLSHGPEVVKECLLLAKPMPIEGLTSYEEHEEEIIKYHRTGGGSRGLSTGWGIMDEYMRVLPGQMMIITGIPQSGKSEWLDALVLNTIKHHKWKWAMYSPENYPIPFHFQKLSEKWTGLPMFARHDSTLAMDEKLLRATIKTLNAYIKPLSFGEEGADLDSILNRVRICVEKYGIKGFVLDPYNEVEHKRPSAMTETEYISQFLSKIRNFGRIHEVMMCIVAHPTKLKKLVDSNGNDKGYPIPSLYDISGSANWRNKADIGISIWRDLDGSGNAVTVKICKIRNKNLGQTGDITLFWNWKNGRFEESQIQ